MYYHEHEVPERTDNEEDYLYYEQLDNSDELYEQFRENYNAD